MCFLWIGLFVYMWLLQKLKMVIQEVQRVLSQQEQKDLVFLLCSCFSSHLTFPHLGKENRLHHLSLSHKLCVLFHSFEGQQVSVAEFF